MRRRYDTAFKAQVLAECESPEASLAEVAMSHGSNDDVLRRWQSHNAMSSEKAPGSKSLGAESE